MRNRRRSKRTGLGLIVIMVLMICGIVSIKRIELDKANAKAEEKVVKLQQEMELAKQEAEDIQEKKAYVQTKKYIEEMAREKLGLVYKNEIIFKSEE